MQIDSNYTEYNSLNKLLNWLESEKEFEITPDEHIRYIGAYDVIVSDEVADILKRIGLKSIRSTPYVTYEAVYNGHTYSFKDLEDFIINYNWDIVTHKLEFAHILYVNEVNEATTRANNRDAQALTRFKK